MIDRQPNGRFAPGNTGGPGRPSAVREAEYREILVSVLTPDHWRRIIERAIDDAERGNHHARTFLAAHTLGTSSKLVIEPPTYARDLTADEKRAAIMEEIVKLRASPTDPPSNPSSPS